MLSDFLSMSDVAKKTDIPYQTLIRYVNRHETFLNVKKEHKSFWVHSDSIEILQNIRKLYQEGLNERQVAKELSLKNIPITIDIPSENEVQNLQSTLQDMSTTIKSLSEKAKNQEIFNRQLLLQLDKQQDYITSSLEERDRKLMESLRQTLETKQQIASAQSKKWWHFWK